MQRKLIMHRIINSNLLSASIYLLAEIGMHLKCSCWFEREPALTSALPFLGCQSREALIRGILSNWKNMVTGQYLPSLICRWRFMGQLCFNSKQVYCLIVNRFTLLDRVRRALRWREPSNVYSATRWEKVIPGRRRKTYSHFSYHLQFKS